MGGTRKLGNRKSVTTQRKGEGARILDFDPARKNLRTPIAHVPKREKPIPRPSIVRNAMRHLVSFVKGIFRALRPQSRGAESSGKRRA